MKEQIKRSVAKTISFRVCLTVSHVANAVIATGNWTTAFQIAGLAAIINSVIYWLHERAWATGGWARSLHAEHFQERWPRSTAKMLTWRVVITASNVLIPYVVTGSWGSAVLFAGLATAVNMLIYWAHERVWNLTPWARVVDKPIEQA